MKCLLLFSPGAPKHHKTFPKVQSPAAASIPAVSQLSPHNPDSRWLELLEKVEENPLTPEDQVKWAKEALRSGGNPFQVLLKIVALFEPEKIIEFGTNGGMA